MRGQIFASLNWICWSWVFKREIQPIASGVSFLQSRISIDNLVLWVSIPTFRWKETQGDRHWRLRLNDTPNAIPDMFYEKSETYQHAFSRSLFDKKSMCLWVHEEPLVWQSTIAVPVNTGSDVWLTRDIEREELKPAPLNAVADTTRNDLSFKVFSMKRSVDPFRRDTWIRLALPQTNPSLVSNTAS